MSDALFGRFSRFNDVEDMIRIMNVFSINDTPEAEIRVHAVFAFISWALDVLHREDIVNYWANSANLAISRGRTN